MIDISRIARKDLNTPFIHVIVQGVNKEYIFYKDDYIKKYMDIIKENKPKYNFTIMAYCMMNNHAHFLIYTEDIKDFGKFMHKINLLYAQFYNREEKRCGILFRNRYVAEPIYERKYLINCIKYIHNNPLKAKIVSSCEDYKYSSYKDYIHNKEITKSKIIKEIFGSNCNFLELFNKTDNINFIDIDKENMEEENEYIMSCIKKFQKNNNKEIYDIFSSRETLKNLIYFLNSNYGIKYVKIRDFLKIPRGIMDTLKKEI